MQVCVSVFAYVVIETFLTYSSPGFGGSRWPCRAIGDVENALGICARVVRRDCNVGCVVGKFLVVVRREKEVWTTRRRD